MATEFSKPNFDESDIIKGLRNVNKELQEGIELNKEYGKGFTESMGDAEDAVTSVDSEIADMTTTLDKQNKKMKEGKDDTKGWSSELTGAAKEQTILGVNVGQVTDRLNKQIASIKAYTTAQKGATIASRVLRGAMIAIPIFALVAGLTAIVTWFTKSQEGIDKLSQKMAGLKEGFGVITTAIANFGKVIIDAFSNPGKLLKDFGDLLKSQITNRLEAVVQIGGAVGRMFKSLLKGDFKALGEEAKIAGDAVLTFSSGLDKTQRSKIVETIKGAAAEMKNVAKESIAAAKAGEDLEKRSQGVRDAQRALNVEFKESRAEVARLQGIAEDLNATDAERIAAASQALSIEEGLLQKRQGLERENLAIIQERNSLSNSFIADLDAEAESKEKIAEFAEESLGRQRELNAKIQTIEKEREATNLAIATALAAQRKELADSLAALEAAAESLNRQFLSPEQRLKAEFEIAKAAADAGFEKLKTLATNHEEEVRIQEAHDKFMLALARDFQNKLARLDPDFKEREKVEVAELDDSAVKRAQDDATAYAESYARTIRDSGGSVAEALGDLKGFIGEHLSIAPEDVDAIFGAISQQLGSIFENLTAKTDALIQENEAKLGALAEQRSELEAQLEDENARNEEGLASRVQGTKDKLAEVQKAEEKAQKEGIELQKKKAKQEAILAAVSQAQNLITAASQIFSATSGIPFVGIALAIASIASMFGAYAKVKSQAKGAARAWKGGDLAKLLGPNRQGTDVPGRGDGYMVGDTGLMIGGNEFLVGEEPKNANPEFLNEFNRGGFNKVNLKALIPDLKATNNRFGTRARRISDTKQRSSEILMRETFGRLASSMIGAIENKPIVVAKGDDQKLYTYTKGRLEIRE